MPEIDTDKSKRNLLRLFETLGEQIETFRAELEDDLKRMGEPPPEAPDMRDMAAAPTAPLRINLCLNEQQVARIERLLNTGLWGLTHSDVVERLLDETLQRRTRMRRRYHSYSVPNPE